MTEEVHTLTQTTLGLGSVIEPNGGAGARILVTFQAIRSGGGRPPEAVELPTLWLEIETARQLASALLSRCGGPGDVEEQPPQPTSLQ